MSVSVTGIGLVTALGSNLSATWDAMLAGRCITEPSRADWPSATGGRSLRVVELGLAAARQAMTDAGWMNGGVDPVEVALIVATSRGAIDDWLSGDRGFGPVNQGQVDDGADGAGYGLAPVVDEIRQELRLGGPSLLYSSACGTGLHALIRAAMMLETGEAGRALVVAAESSMHPLFAASFKRMGVLSPASTPCRPFDKNRQGFHIAEAAAAVCLESARTRAALSRVGAFGLGADGFHLTSPLPDGATLARLLAQVADRRQIDLFHAHGTGTELNDEVEMAAIEGYAAGMAGRAAVYSHKGAVGHTLGAAGLVGAVLTCQMMRCGLILPNAQTFDPLPTTHVELPRGPLVRQIRHAIVLAAGFGGPQAAIRLDCPGETP